MKHIFVIVLVSMLTGVNAQQHPADQFILKGSLPKQDGNFVYLSYMGKDGKYVRDSVVVNKGAFQFRGSIKEPTSAGLHGKLTSRAFDDPNNTIIFLEPGNMTVAIEDGKYKDAVVTGSKTEIEYAQLQKQISKVRSRWKVVMDTLSAVNKRSNFQYQELKDWVLVPYTTEIKEIQYAFFNNHPGSYITASELRVSRDVTTDSLKLFYNRFPDKVKESSYGKTVLAEIEKRKIGVPGTMAKDFSTVDINGNKLSLSDYRGKYVLLDFWASWCVPCRKGNPHLKELYAAYHAKGFEVIGVSDDDRDHAAWKKAVAQDDLPWKHILRGLKYANGVFDRSTDISEGFNISSLPTQLLIDPTGKIIGRYGEGAEDHALLDKQLETFLK